MMTAPSPALIFDTLNGYQRSAALRAAIELDLFSAIGRGERTTAAIAKSSGAAERGVRILCDYLTVIGLLTKDAAGAYGLTQDSAVFLDRKSPAYMGGTVKFLHGDELFDSFDRLTDAVRRGGTASDVTGGTTAAEHPVWIDFARAMAPLMAMPSEQLAKLVDPDASTPLKILDISASHGLWGLAFARRNLNAKVVGIDWPKVLEVAKETAEKIGVADRYSTIPGSAFDVDFGAGYELILLPNFLHHFDPPTCTKLLTKCHKALAANGRCVTVEFIPDDNRVTPPPSATFALTMLAMTPKGDAYTFAEYERMHRDAGFSRSELHPLEPTMQRVVIGYK
jgi:2-polyprenyl-3-methyl-5-hydroxy-6-metoxy-1,4-benzoquinol methylase